jgi:hypothetical protein
MCQNDQIKLEASDLTMHHVDNLLSPYLENHYRRRREALIREMNSARMKDPTKQRPVL